LNLKNSKTGMTEPKRMAGSILEIAYETPGEGAIRLLQGDILDGFPFCYIHAGEILEYSL